MTSATPDLRLPSQLQSITAMWLYQIILFRNRGTCVRVCDGGMAGGGTCDFWVTSRMILSFHYQATIINDQAIFWYFCVFFVNTEIILNSFWRSLMGVTTFAPQCNFSSVWRPWNQNRVTLKHIVAESCCHLSACDVCDKPWYQDTGSCSSWWQLTTFVVYRVQCISCTVLNVGCTYLLVLYVLSCSTSMKIPVCWYFFDVTQLILALLTSSMFFVALCCWVILLIDFLSF